jgi:glycosyltransferase involved in cell wall biosynthesis|tara:strand:- start:829 stop:1626 length:798 start_codon:yes stop_codon:yes gene_type:complete
MKKTVNLWFQCVNFIMCAVRSDRILIIIPCRNEQSRIGNVIADIRHSLPHATIAVIDDESSDRTAEEAAAAGARVLPHEVNLGYGAALQTGYHYALTNGFDIVLQMDGDGQHLATELPTILQPIRDDLADLVIGSRYLDTTNPLPTSFARRAGQRFFAWLVRASTRRRFTDPTSGFQALGARALDLYTRGLFPSDYPDADILLTAHIAGLRILEAPVEMRERAHGQSMHTAFSSLYYVVKMLLSLFIVVLNRRRLMKEISHVHNA